MVSRGRQVAPLRVYTGSLDVASCPLPSELLSLPGFIDNGFRMKGKQPCSVDSPVLVSCLLQDNFPEFLEQSLLTRS